jgi:hypothetical protein
MTRWTARWVRDGTSWRSTVFPGWRIVDTGQKDRRDRYVIVRPDGTEDRNWHKAHMHKRRPGLSEAQWSAEARARMDYHTS